LKSIRRFCSILHAPCNKGLGQPEATVANIQYNNTIHLQD
jgi:hypothetical protein